eukprot:15017868-Alexandrium_andersonii.AAC.1
MLQSRRANKTCQGVWMHTCTLALCVPSLLGVLRVLSTCVRTVLTCPPLRGRLGSLSFRALESRLRRFECAALRAKGSASTESKWSARCIACFSAMLFP